ncbi:predicted protein [Streptomyces viridosporus ATCC 14672]|uniref:Predicted protein n=1 Tax=Streptomyces viridosporus (strain ATCC 14672 / DSM 40746 / JCM 4963 / KCTC 9882 / NRRL B-12104 / FH 1290) TaxID=566461 RepID=D5ZS96_STRV1|nr:predicted protein [Streptomyces viridosporus ATCC 14672]
MGSSVCIGFSQADARRILRPRLTGRPPVSPIGHSDEQGGGPRAAPGHSARQQPRPLYPVKFGTIYPPGVYDALPYTRRTR